MKHLTSSLLQSVKAGEAAFKRLHVKHNGVHQIIDSGIVMFALLVLRATADRGALHTGFALSSSSTCQGE